MDESDELVRGKGSIPQKPARDLREAFATTLICCAVDVPFVHELPHERDARQIAADISKAGIARPQ